MYLLFIILNKEELLDDILSVFVELELEGASVWEGISMERMLAKDIPIFSGLIDSIIGPHANNKNIVVPIKDKDVIEELLEILEEMDIDFSQQEVGSMFLLPVESININN